MADQNPDWLKLWSLYSPQKTALVDIQNDTRYAYLELYQRSCATAAYLKKVGVQSGDRVGVLAHNRVETLFLFFALQRLNAILVPINYRLTGPEIDYILEDSGCRILFCDPLSREVTQNLKSTVTIQPIEVINKASEPSGELFEDYQGSFESPCKILYTSGTTGFPKGVVITSKILFWNSINTSISLDITSEDITINFSPLFHTGGWNVLMTPFFHRGATVIFMQKFDAETVLRLIEEENVTLFFGVPTTLSMMAETELFSQVDFSKLRYAVVGGESMPLAMIKTWHDKKVAIRQGFGMTECGPNCFSLNHEHAEDKIGSIGRPNFYVNTRVVDEKGRNVDTGQVGELLLQGPMCMEQYWQNSEATERSLDKGWLRTGDLVRFDQDQFYYVVGRKKEMFISGGENIYPAEVEKVIGSHPDVSEVAVLGVEDPQWGEVGKAFLVTRDNKPLTKDQVIEFCQSRLAKYKIPKEVEFKSSLPKGDSGKILKRELANLR